MKPFGCKWQNLSGRWPTFWGEFRRMPRGTVLASWTVSVPRAPRRCLLQDNRYWQGIQSVVLHSMHGAFGLQTYFMSVHELAHTCVQHPLQKKRSPPTPPLWFSWVFLCCFNSNPINSLVRYLRIRGMLTLVLLDVGQRIVCSQEPSRLF